MLKYPNCPGYVEWHELLELTKTMVSSCVQLVWAEVKAAGDASWIVICAGWQETLRTYSEWSRMTVSQWNRVSSVATMSASLRYMLPF